MLQIFDLNRLRTFYYLYQERSLSRAAHSLHITPSAVRQSLKKLEADLATQLFLTAGKTYVPTQRANELFPKVRSALENLQEGLQIFRADKAGFEGRIRIGTPIEFGHARAVEAIAKFAQKHPLLRIRVEMGDTKDLIDSVMQNRLDLAFVDDGSFLTKSRSLVAKRIFKEELHLASSKVFASKHLPKKLNLASLAALPHILYNDTEEATAKWYRHHFKRLVEVNETFAVNTAKGVLQAIQMDLGLGVIPAYFISDELRKSIHVIEGNKNPLVNSICLIQLAMKIPSEAEKALTKFLLLELT